MGKEREKKSRRERGVVLPRTPSRLILLATRRYDTCFLKWYSESKSPLPSPLHPLFSPFPSPPASYCPPHTSLLCPLSLTLPHRSSYPNPNIHLEYLRSPTTTDECEPLFRQYKACLTGALKDRGIEKMIQEVRESGEIDVLGPGGNGGAGKGGG